MEMELGIAQKKWNTAQENHGPIIKSKLEMRHVTTWKRWAEGSSEDKAYGIFFSWAVFLNDKGEGIILR